jgi:hypothetical protein
MPASPSLLIVPARFKTGKLYTQIATTSAGVVLGSSGDFNVTRATTATRFNSAGLIESVASGVPRLDYYTSGGTAGCPALLVEPAATNLALHSRDLTNAVWSGTNVNTAKNAVGADGVASGATTLTATAASGTVLQALSHASQSRVFSAYIRRVTGTGAIELTTNGGTNWTTVTISSLYTQVACAAQTVASGTIGIRLAVSGDVIEVDFTQGEVGPAATSPNATTSGTVTRNADVINLSGAVSGCIGQTEGTIYCEFAYFGEPIIRSGPVYLRQANARGLSISAAPGEGIAFISRNDGGSTTITLVSGALQIGAYYKIAIGYNAGGTAAGGSQASGVVAYVNGTQRAIDTFRVPDAARLTEFRMYGANAGTDAEAFNGRIRSAALYTTRLTNSELAALTT